MRLAKLSEAETMTHLDSTTCTLGSLKPLTDTQRDILRRAANDECDKEIAADLGLSVRTVRWHWDCIRLKTGRRSRLAAAMAWARQPDTVRSASSGRAE